MKMKFKKYNGDIIAKVYHFRGSPDFLCYSHKRKFFSLACNEFLKARNATKEEYLGLIPELSQYGKVEIQNN